MAKKCILSLLLLLVLQSVSAKEQPEFVEGCFRYAVDNDSVVRVVGLSGDSLHTPEFADSTMVIPGTVVHDARTYQVQSIGRHAFEAVGNIKHLVIGEGVEFVNDAFVGCGKLESVRLSSTVNAVDESAFDYCPNLRSIVVDEGNEWYDSRNGCNAVIESESGTLVLGCYKTVIPEGVTIIGKHAFDCCIRLDSLVIPEGVKKLSVGCFQYCPSLRYVQLPKSLETIETFVFDGCRLLDSVFIPENVSEIGEGILSGCYNLRSVKVDKKNRIYDSREDCNAVVETSRARIVAGCGSSKIVDGIHEIGEFAFHNASLSHISIPSTVFRIGEDAFSYCKFCTSISVSRDNSVYHSDDGCNAIIEKATGRLVQGCAGTVISDVVKELGFRSFAGVTLPSTFVIPEGVMKIDRYAFFDCASLKCVVFSGSSTHVEWNAFGGCTQLGFVFLPDNIERIDKDAFRNCPYEKLFMEHIKSGER